MSGMAREGYLDPAVGGRAVVTVLDRVCEKLLEHDQKPNPLRRGKSVTKRKRLGKGDEAAELGRFAVQAERFLHRAPAELPPRVRSSELAAIGAREAN